MRYYADGKNFIVVLAKGEELMAALAQFAEESGTKTAWLQGLGAALKVELGYYQLDKQKYRWKTFEGPLEITILQGNIVQKDAKSFIHMHGSFSNQDYGVVGGHLKDLTVAGTCEILVKPLNSELTRKRDNQVGLELLEPTRG